MGPWMMCLKLYGTLIYINVSNEIVIDRIELVIFPTFPIESLVHFPWGWNERDKGGQECLVIDNAELLRIHHCTYATLSVLIWTKTNGFARRVLVWIYLLCCIYICFSMAKPNLVRRKYACYKERERQRECVSERRWKQFKMYLLVGLLQHTREWCWTF